MTVPGFAPREMPAAEDESYRILRSRIDLTQLPRFSRDVTEAVIHASADFDYFTDLVCHEEALEAGVAALAAGAPVIVDSAMVAAGITGCPVITKLGEPLTERLARTAAISPAAAAVRLAFGDAGPGAVWVVGGSAPALQEMLARRVEPAFVVGFPVGFVGAAAAKDALRATGVPSVSNVSEKGGAAVAVAAFGALLAPALQARGGPGGAGQDDAADRRRGPAAGG
ncbi:MAG TPA: precorrin-8X methylmutase [Streptosporangiaceae bacterium]|nr:precorrin-8X methylmutase [Streptosporangiaceae bacterium]